MSKVVAPEPFGFEKVLIVLRFVVLETIFGYRLVVLETIFGFKLAVLEALDPFDRFTLRADGQGREGSSEGSIETCRPWTSSRWISPRRRK